MSAALEPQRWLESLDTMASHMGASHGQLIGVGGERDVPFNLVTNFAPPAFDEFIAIGGGSPEVNFRIAASAEHLSRGFYDPILHEKHYEEVVPCLQSRRYVEWCDDVDIPFGCQTNLVVDGYGLIGLAMLRKRKEGRTTREQRQMFAKAAEAARRAVRLQERLEGQQVGFLRGAFDAIGICAFVLDRRGELLAHTAKADELLSAGAVKLSGKLLSARSSPLSLGAAVQSLCSEAGLPHFRLRVDHLPTGRPLALEGFRLPQRPWSFGKAPHAVVVANPPRRDRAGNAQFLIALYQLTPAEADIALRLAEGSARANIAEMRGVSGETLRGQIKSLQSKCGVDGEAALMRLLGPLLA